MRANVLFVVIAVVAIGFLNNCNREMGGSGNPYIAPIAGDSVVMPVNYLNYWVYDVSEMVDTVLMDTSITIQLDSVKHINNTDWYYDPWIGGYIHNYSSGIWVLLGISPADSTVYLRYPVVAGQRWYSYGDSTICTSTTDTARLGSAVYYDCVRYRTYSNGRYFDQVFKPGIGMLSFETDTTNTSIYHYEILTLQSYRLY